jgi:putative exosortase-associated protein (TIGR04073 family)
MFNRINITGYAMKKITFPILLLSLLIVSTSSFAEELERQSYGSKVGHKALNALANIATAELEIPKNIINTVNDSNIILGTVGGLMKGIIHTLGRIGVGVVDLITAPIPTKPIAQPAYIWEDYDIDTTYGDVFRLDR